MKQRSRVIKPGFWVSDELADLGIYAHHLFGALLHIADREGRLEDRPPKIKLFCAPFYDVSIDDLLSQLHARLFITRYEASGCKYIQINGWTDHMEKSIHWHETPSIIPACKKLNRRKVAATSVVKEKVEVEPKVEGEETQKEKVKKPADDRPPIDRFNEWLSNNFDIVCEMARDVKQDRAGDEMMLSTNKWIRDEIAKMRTWVRANPEKGKKLWKRFVSNWLIRTLNVEPKPSGPGHMTAEEERQYYENKRRRDGSSSEPTSVAEILAKAKEKTDE